MFDVLLTGVRRRKGMRGFLGLSILLAGTPALAAEVNIYSYREPQLIAPMLEMFTERTGIEVNISHLRTGMLERLESEGRNTPADVVFTVDIGRLVELTDAGLTQPVNAPEINDAIPANYRASSGHWFGLTARARIIVVSKTRVGADEIADYEDLASPRFRRRVCTRSGKHPYNVALGAMMIEHHGLNTAEQWLAGVKANLARRPEGNDRAQVKAIHAGLCDVAVINHYYLHQMATNPEQQPWVQSVRVIFPNQDDRGTHMNISGMAMTEHAPHPKEALALMKFLASPEAQRLYAQVNGEYPVRPEIQLTPYLVQLGDFKRDELPLDQVARQRAEAAKMSDRVDFDE